MPLPVGPWFPCGDEQKYWDQRSLVQCSILSGRLSEKGCLISLMLSYETKSPDGGIDKEMVPVVAYNGSEIDKFLFEN